MSLESLFSVAAFVLSLMSLWFAHYSWRQSNRPLVTAFVVEHAMGNVSSVFDLIVSNSGTQPAINVQLHAIAEDVEKLTDEDAPSDRKEDIKRCFSDEAKIPVLRNGEELRTAFGSFNGTEAKFKWLNYGVTIQIKVSYGGLDGSEYKSKIPLKIYARSGFAGSSWQAKK